jgi:pyrimidine operon attenuation protein/uracil phosphoribosyltransferase
VGKNLPTSAAEKVRVRLAEVDGESGAADFPEDHVAIEAPQEESAAGEETR